MQKKSPKDGTHSVALLVETSTDWGSGIVAGVSRYSREHGPWMLFLEPRGRSEPVALPPSWRGDGVIARVNSSKLARDIIKRKLPAVNVSWFDCGAGIPKVSTDEDYTGRLAARHFLERGFVEFAYCGPMDRPNYTDHIGAGYCDELESVGFRCHRFRPGNASKSTWQNAHPALKKWLTGLPRPSALFAWNDVVARVIAEVCLANRIHVPEEVAILSGEYDSLMNEASPLRISSIDHSPETIGFEAAKALHRSMLGRRPTKRPKLLRNMRIVTRQSSDIMAIDDELLAAAITFMRRHANEGILVSDVMKAVPMSRRVLEEKCKALLGRSPAAEIRRQRIEEAKELLATTNLPMDKVAQRSGYRDGNIFGRHFRVAVGETPTAYRRRCRC